MSQVRAIQLRRGTRAELDSYGPLLIGELGFCTDTGELFIGTPSGNTLVNPETIDWSKVTGKPGTFTPSSHSHAWGDITGKPGTFTPSSHSHAWGDITGKPGSFTPSSHTHTWSQVTNAPATATRWPSWSEVTGKPSTFTPSSHTHSKSDVGLGSVQNYGIATQAQAEAGTANNVYMTPLRVKEAIESLGSALKIATGSFTWKTTTQSISVGFAPKYVLIKQNNTGGEYTAIANANFRRGPTAYADGRTTIAVTSTGFSITQSDGGSDINSGTWYYVAIG